MLQRHIAELRLQFLFDFRPGSAVTSGDVLDDRVECGKFYRAREFRQLFEHPRFDLPDTFSRQPLRVSDFLQRLLGTRNAKATQHHLPRRRSVGPSTESQLHDSVDFAFGGSGCLDFGELDERELWLGTCLRFRMHRLGGRLWFHEGLP